jgi:hypothetical protein
MSLPYGFRNSESSLGERHSRTGGRRERRGASGSQLHYPMS